MRSSRDGARMDLVGSSEMRLVVFNCDAFDATRATCSGPKKLLPQSMERLDGEPKEQKS